MYKNYRKTIGILILFILICSMLIGCMQKDTISTIDDKMSVPTAVDLDQDNIMQIIKVLVSEKYRGRLAGTAENQMAAQYIADYFKEIGLENPKGLDNYMQAYTQPSIVLKDAPVLQIVDKNGKVLNDFNYPENFVLRRLSSETNSIDMEADMILIEKPEVLRVFNEDLKGKVILLPWEHYNLLQSQNNPMDFAEMFDASAVISEFDLSKNNLGYNYLKIRPLAEKWMMLKAYKPFAFVDSSTFSKLKEAAKNGCKLHFSCNSVLNPDSIVNNVVGLISGSDLELKDNHIIIGAHFDHLGDNMNGSYNPGALDNATGTAVMMELARVIKENKTPPKQSIVFIAFNGEESGLYGSQHYCKNPIIPLDNAVMINLDMVGSSVEIPLTIAVASSSSQKSLRNDLVKYVNKMHIDYGTEYEGTSDHAAFDKYGIPAVCLINMDVGYGYHTPHDTIKAVDGARVKEVAGLVLEYIANKAY